MCGLQCDDEELLNNALPLEGAVATVAFKNLCLKFSLLVSALLKVIQSKKKDYYQILKLCLLGKHVLYNTKM